MAGLLVLALVGSACRSQDPAAVGETGDEHAGTQATRAQVEAGTRQEDGAAMEGTAPAVATASEPEQEPTQSASAQLATEVAAREQPRYLRSIGNRSFGDGTFQLPIAMDMDEQGQLYVLDTTGIQVFDAEGTFLRRFGDPSIAGAQSIAVAPDGSRVYVGVRPGPGNTAREGVTIVGLDAEGTPATRIGQPGDGPGQLASPAALSFGPDGGLYVADAANQRIEVFGSDGAHRRTIGEPGEGRGQLSSPRAIGFGQDGRLYVGQGDNFLVQHFDADGAYEDTFGRGQSDETLFRVGGIALGEDGRVYVTRAANHYIQVFDAQAHDWLGDFGSLGRGPSEFNTPLDCMTRGNELFVVDQQNHRVQVFELPDPRD